MSVILRHAAAVLLSAALGANAQETAWRLKLTGLAAAPVAEGVESSSRVALEPSVKLKAHGLEIRTRARFRWLKLDDGERADADVRELTLAWRRADTTFTLGAQQLNWGRMDILRVTDIINPVDQNDLFHEELPEAKLALWMANLEWQDGSRSLQLVVTPQVPVDRLPQRVRGLPVSVSEPRDSIENATVAARFGFEASGWSADLIAARGWQPTPTLTPVVGINGLSLQGAPSRQSSLGFSADKPFGSTVLRVEGLVARTSPGNDAPAIGATARRHATLGIGADVRAGPWFFAGQVIAQQKRDDVAATTRRTYVSAIVQRKWLQDRLAARWLHVRETHASSSWSSLQASYQLSPNHLLQVQGDWFRGEPTQLFGNFRQRSRIAASMRLEF